MSNFKKIETSEFNELKDQIALVDFWAPWCGPCLIMEPVLEEKVAPRFPSVNFYKVNTDENQDLAIKYGIRSIPNMVLMKISPEGESEILHSFVGVQDAFEMVQTMQTIVDSQTKGIESDSDTSAKEVAV